jgi:hypothetical protein
MAHTLMVLPLLLGLAQGPPTNSILMESSKSSTVLQFVADNKKDDRDPGKEITDDPHGPGPYGKSGDDEIHDNKMPANNLDPYGNKKD